jgi:CDP-diacylglycerol--glycerol-3-phosphate 3-phosphatidyltransferase
MSQPKASSPQAPLPNWKRQLPNAITWFRIACVPIIIALLSGAGAYNGYFAAAIFILASLSDYFDGQFARAWGVTSNLGKLLDPVADKILVTSTLIMLIPTGKLDVYMVMILIARDTLIEGIRSAAAADRIVIPAGVLGKWKTAIQMVAIPTVLIHESVGGIPLAQVGYAILWLSVVLSVVSGARYIWDYYRHPGVPRS